jgi:CRP-like cAMP-binding protein
MVFSQRGVGVAGSNVILKQGQLIFREGEDSDGMYLVRKGELVVFLERDGNEVQLAKIPAGGMVGEMALFDRQPRSASVRAQADAEVTKISSADFAALIKQIPKWFVGILTSLSGRLRDTNIRLQKIEEEQKGQTTRYELLLKVLYVLDLTWYRHSVKVGKEFVIEREIILKTLRSVFKWSKEDSDKLINVLLIQRLITRKQNDYKMTVYGMQNRGVLVLIVEFLEDFLRTTKNISCLPDYGLEMLSTLSTLAVEQSYDHATISIKEVLSAGERVGLDVSQWNAVFDFFPYPLPFLQKAKCSDGSMGFRVNKEKLPRFVEYHRIVAGFAKAKIDR